MKAGYAVVMSDFQGDARPGNGSEGDVPRYHPGRQAWRDRLAATDGGRPYAQTYGVKIDQVLTPRGRGSLANVTRRYAAQLCAAGAALTFKQYPGAGHFDVVGASEADVLAWMAAVRAGRTPATTCRPGEAHRC